MTQCSSQKFETDLTLCETSFLLYTLSTLRSQAWRNDARVQAEQVARPQRKHHEPMGLHKRTHRLHIVRHGQEIEARSKRNPAAGPNRFTLTGESLEPRGHHSFFSKISS